MCFVQTFWVQSSTLAGWALPRGSTGRRPVSTGRRPVRKKRPTKWVFFFWFPLRFSDASSRSGLTDFSPHSNIYLSPFIPWSFIPWLHYKRLNGAGCIDCQGRVERGACRVDRQGVFRPKTSLARCSSRLTLGTLNFEILLWTFQF